jgi:hypothetical protein
VRCPSKSKICLFAEQQKAFGARSIARKMRFYWRDPC